MNFIIRVLHKVWGWFLKVYIIKLNNRTIYYLNVKQIIYTYLFTRVIHKGYPINFLFLYFRRITIDIVDLFIVMK